MPVRRARAPPQVQDAPADQRRRGGVERDRARRVRCDEDGGDAGEVVPVGPAGAVEDADGGDWRGGCSERVACG